MNRVVTIQGGGTRTEKSDPALVAKVIAERERLGLGEEVIVLTPIQAAARKMDDAKEVRDRLEVALVKMSDDFLKADTEYKAAHRAYLSQQRRGNKE